MGARSQSITITYPDGLEAALLKALPSPRSRKRTAAELLDALRTHKSLRSVGGATLEQIDAALSAMCDRGQFNPDEYIIIPEVSGRHGGGNGILVTSGAH